MGFKLPRLLTDVDCAPIGYPGLIVRFWLNPTSEQYEPPENGQPWESVYWHSLGRVIECINIPGSMTDDGKEQTIEIADGKALYDLTSLDGFDYQIIIWSLNQYQAQRQERLKAELKN